MGQTYRVIRGRVVYSGDHVGATISAEWIALIRNTLGMAFILRDAREGKRGRYPFLTLPCEPFILELYSNINDTYVPPHAFKNHSRCQR